MNHKNNVFLFDHEKVIQIKSNFEATCSYGDTLSFLYYKQNPTENRSLSLGSQEQLNYEKYMEKKRAILPKYRKFPFKAMSDLQGSSIQTTSSHVVSIRSIDRNILN